MQFCKVSVSVSGPPDLSQNCHLQMDKLRADEIRKSLQPPGEKLFLRKGRNDFQLCVCVCV